MIVSERVRADVSARTRFGDLREWDTIDSTNRWVAEQAAAGAAEGLVAVADDQSAGRGRLGRSWEAPPGTCLLMSVLLRPGLPASRLHLATTLVGLAARQACAQVAGVTAALKWPNDLLARAAGSGTTVGDAKLAGVLAEGVAGAVVVGLGLNVSWAPAGAVSLRDAGSGPVDRGELLAAVLSGVEARYGDWDAVAGEYRAACATVGRRVRVEQAGATLVGRADTLDADGRLVLVDDTGRRVAVAAGDIVHVRPADQAGW